jgi:hypothetical protein
MDEVKYEMVELKAIFSTIRPFLIAIAAGVIVAVIKYLLPNTK